MLLSLYISADISKATHNLPCTG